MTVVPSKVIIPVVSSNAPIGVSELRLEPLPFKLNPINFLSDIVTN